MGEWENEKSVDIYLIRIEDHEMLSRKDDKNEKLNSCDDKQNT